MTCEIDIVWRGATVVLAALCCLLTAALIVQNRRAKPDPTLAPGEPPLDDHVHAQKRKPMGGP